MIKDDVLVFDCVAHPFNFDPSNALGKAGEMFNNHLYAFHQVLTPENEPKLSEEKKTDFKFLDDRMKGEGKDFHLEVIIDSVTKLRAEGSILKSNNTI